MIFSRITTHYECEKCHLTNFTQFQSTSFLVVIGLITLGSIFYIPLIENKWGNDWWVAILVLTAQVTIWLVVTIIVVLFLTGEGKIPQKCPLCGGKIQRVNTRFFHSFSPLIDDLLIIVIFIFFQVAIFFVIQNI